MCQSLSWCRVFFSLAIRTGKSFETTSWPSLAVITTPRETRNGIFRADMRTGCLTPASNHKAYIFRPTANFLNDCGGFFGLARLQEIFVSSRRPEQRLNSGNSSGPTRWFLTPTTHLRPRIPSCRIDFGENFLGTDKCPEVQETAMKRSSAKYVVFLFLSREYPSTRSLMLSQLETSFFSWRLSEWVAYCSFVVPMSRLKKIWEQRWWWWRWWCAFKGIHVSARNCTWSSM